MANWHGTARSNYFHVKDDEAFEAWANSLSLDCFQDDEGRYAIAAQGWPTSNYDDEEDEEYEVFLTMDLSTHLREGEVAVLMEVGNEKLRYLTGTAVAVNHKGEQVSVSLDSIYEKAALAFGNDNITLAEY